MARRSALLPALVPVLILATLLGRCSGCDGLGCTLTGEMRWRLSTTEVDSLTLALNVTAAARTPAATGTLRHASGAVESVHATVALASAGREAMLTWRGLTRTPNTSETVVTNWSALILDLSAEHVWIHGGNGVLAELTRIGITDEIDGISDTNDTAPTADAADATGAAGANATGTSAEASNETAAEAAQPAGARALAQVSAEAGSTGIMGELGPPGSLIRIRSLTDSTACLAADAEGTTARFGPCDTEEALWEVGKGVAASVRGLRHSVSGKCLQRRCYHGGSAAAKMGPCGQCGTARCARPLPCAAHAKGLSASLPVVSRVRRAPGARRLASLACAKRPTHA